MPARRGRSVMQSSRRPPRHKEAPISDSPYPARGPWRIRSVASAYANPWIELRHHEVLQPDGRPGIYGVVHFKNIAVAILPIDGQGHTWLVGQHRFPLDAYSWELPEGGGALDADPVLAAQRELKEETGLEAESYRRILTMHLSNSVSDELSVSYLATGLTQGRPEPEGSEELHIKRIPFAEALEMALDGRITDALSVATILRAHLLFLREPELLGGPADTEGS
jgi:8-oxo-dGTP pyrophosphatase MutT (NUDIX family)